MIAQFEPVFDLLDALLDGPVLFNNLDVDYRRYVVWSKAVTMGWVVVDASSGFVYLTETGERALVGYRRMKLFERENVWQWWMPLTKSSGGLHKEHD